MYNTIVTELQKVFNLICSSEPLWSRYICATQI